MPPAATGNETYYDQASNTTYTYDANGQLTSYPGPPESTASSWLSQNIALVSAGVGVVAILVSMGKR